ncbi:hypothetical protein GUJ93_ZPchr0013g36225 [Zizania palustris]|uniref:DUF4378 domain-containing protein n=1 Tax=Zizania palustris TaxID=103762 RepID=A0A8J5X308_ZIZPA|nr:hypothetical protein GUJ93_ZPchr0013g36225 [Zizania palustris]
MKAPGVVARLMGLDAMPSTGAPEPYCTPFRDTRSFRDSHSLNRSPESSRNDQFSYMPRRVDGYIRKPLDLRVQKMPSSPIERFQIEALPPRSAKSIPMSHHRLLSPIKNPGFSSARNAAQIMEAAAKILEPRPQVSSREKICSYSPARIPLRVSETREHNIPSSQRAASRQLQSLRTPVQLPDVRFSRGQQMNQSWNSEEDIVIFRTSSDSYEINNHGCSKNNKGKSISLALQAKVNVQKREGLSSSGKNSGVQKQHDEFRTSQPFRSQSNAQKSKQQKKPSSSGTSSPILRQNNQKQNSLVSRGKSAPNKSVSSQQGRKVAGDSSSGKLKNGSKVSKGGSRKDIVESINGDREGSSSNNKDFPQKKRLIERNSTNEKGTFVSEKPAARLQKKVQPNVVMDEHIKWNNESKDTTDVVSFTFTSPLVKPSAGPSRLSGKWDSRNNFGCDVINEKDDTDKKAEGLPSVGMNFVNGDALSLLLEKKLKELTSKIEPSINFTRGDTFVPSTFSLEEPAVSSSSNWDMESGVLDCSPSEVKSSQYVDYCQSAQSSTKGQIFCGNRLKVEEPEECSSISNTRKEKEHKDLSPLSVLEPILSESCWSSECCSGSNDGNKQYSSSSEVKTIPRNFLINPPSVDTEAKTADSVSSSSIEVSDTSASIDASDISDITQCSKKSRNSELEYIGDVVGSVNLTKGGLGSLFINEDVTALDPLLFDKLESMNLYTQGKNHMDRRGYRRLLFDCVSECLEMRRLTYFQAGYAAWSKGMAAMSRGIETEVCNEIGDWKGMCDWVEDELVDKDMSSGLGTWVDFRVEQFETGEEVEREILSSLLDEVIGDVFVRRRQECKFVI